MSLRLRVAQTAFTRISRLKSGPVVPMTDHKLQNSIQLKWNAAVTSKLKDIITYANKFPYIILLTETDQYFSKSKN